VILTTSSSHRIMTSLTRSLASALLLGALVASPAAAQSTKAPDVVLRLDDIGMNHSVNQAIEKVAATGMPISASVLFVCPWYQEAVDILKKYPNVTVGVHVALNSEWRGYRWGPVLGKGGVPSLVDSAGYLRPSVPDFLQSKYDLAEVERELSAQMDRAMASGLKIAYLDPHMGTAASTPQLREVMERVARKYNVGISTYFDERYNSIWGTAPNAKKSQLLDVLSKAPTDRPTLVEVHVAERTPEMEAIVDMNAAEQNAPGAGVVDHRKAELETMLSPELAELRKSGKVRLLTYEQLIAQKGGPSAMHRPAPERPTP
jgi:chitin disaccharide deacetylase